MKNYSLHLFLTGFLLISLGCEQPMPEDFNVTGVREVNESAAGDGVEARTISISAETSFDFTVEGTGFWPEVSRHVGCGGESFLVNDNFHVQIISSNSSNSSNDESSEVTGIAYDMVSVHWISTTEVNATLPQEVADEMDPGVYDVKLISPSGYSAVLDDGLTVVSNNDGPLDTDTQDTDTLDTDTLDTDTVDTDTVDTDTLDTDTFDTDTLDTDTVDTDTLDTDTLDTDTVDTDTVDTDTVDTDTVDTELPPDPSLHGPLAMFTVTPAGGDTSGTVTFDTTGSSDAETAYEDLLFEWDFFNDGTYISAVPYPNIAFVIAGIYTVTLRVTDGDGMVDYYSGPVVIADESQLIVVNSDKDATDGNANLTTLREAIAEANSYFGPNTILIPEAMEIPLKSDLPVLIDSNTTIVGTAGVIIKGEGKYCFRDDSTTIGLGFYWLEITECNSAAITLGGDDHQVSNCQLYENADRGITVMGERLIIGPENRIYSNTNEGVWVNSSDVIVEGNFIYKNGKDGVKSEGSADNLIIRQNLIQKNEFGMALSGEASGVEIVNNTFYMNLKDGINIFGGEQYIVNNIFAENTEYGINGLNNATLNNDYNNFFGNGSGDCSNCSAGANSLAVDPDFVDPNDIEFRVSGYSQCVNMGIDSGADLNGPTSGDYNQSAPDLGHWESPW